MATAKKDVETKVIVTGVTLTLTMDEAEALASVLAVCSLATPVHSISDALFRGAGIDQDTVPWAVYKGGSTHDERDRITLINMKRT